MNIDREEKSGGYKSTPSVPAPDLKKKKVFVSRLVPTIRPPRLTGTQENRRCQHPWQFDPKSIPL